jgi:hypothetical protein
VKKISTLHGCGPIRTKSLPFERLAAEWILGSNDLIPGYAVGVVFEECWENQGRLLAVPISVS